MRPGLIMSVVTVSALPCALMAAAMAKQREEAWQTQGRESLSASLQVALLHQPIPKSAFSYILLGLVFPV